MHAFDVVVVGGGTAACVHAAPQRGAGAVAPRPTARVRGLDGVYVADASFPPKLPRSNTNMTVAAVAERISSLLT